MPEHFLFLDVTSTIEIAFMVFCILVAAAVLYMFYYAIALYFIDPYIRLKALSIREEGFISYHLPFYRKSRRELFGFDQERRSSLMVR